MKQPDPNSKRTQKRLKRNNGELKDSRPNRRAKIRLQIAQQLRRNAIASDPTNTEVIARSMKEPGALKRW